MSTVFCQNKTFFLQIFKFQKRPRAAPRAPPLLGAPCRTGKSNGRTRCRTQLATWKTQNWGEENSLETLGGRFWSLTLAPIWLPHWPAWMWTISLMVSASTCLRGCLAASGWRSWRRVAVEEEEEGGGGGGPAELTRGRGRGGSWWPSRPAAEATSSTISSSSTTILPSSHLWLSSAAPPPEPPTPRPALWLRCSMARPMTTFWPECFAFFSPRSIIFPG